MTQIGAETNNIAIPKRFVMPSGWRITDQKLKDKLAAMNRQQRRAWAAKAENRKGR